MRWSQQQRMLFIGQRLLEHGSIIRRDLQEAFGISTAQASVDFRTYQKLQPGVMTYDATRKAYVVNRRVQVIAEAQEDA